MVDVTVPEQVDLFGLGTGVESDLPDDEADLEHIAEPFDPDNIDVVTKPMTVDLLLSRAKSGMIDLQPEFQRRWGIWDAKRQSRLIESLLLRIPLPVIYAAEDDEERWEIVDGIQRLSTIARYIDSSIIDEPPLKLTGLEHLTNFDGLSFSELSARLQLRLRETELVIHLIRKGTPVEVKFNIFARINTGGVALSPQELRHAITPGGARKLLEYFAAESAFLRATDYSVRTIRMDDRELVLRFLAFKLLGVAQYKQADMDGFLITAMKHINSLGEGEVEAARAEFVRAMDIAYSIFQFDAFRKRYDSSAPRLPINKALFESISVNLSQLCDDEVALAIAHRDDIQEGLIGLCNNRQFEAAISQGTGDTTKVQRRFSWVAEMLKMAIQQ